MKRNYIYETRVKLFETVLYIRNKKTNFKWYKSIHGEAYERNSSPTNS